VTLPAQSQAPWRLVAVGVSGRKTLAVRFVDGTTGRVDLGRFLCGQGVDGTVFEALRDDLFFAQAAVADGAVRWPNGADLSPDAMYDAIRQSGCWTVA
jgi:hypothetical protein